MIYQPNIFITYAWADNDDDDFSYIEQKLKSADIKSIYDRVAIIPGLRLWEQIAQQINSDQLSGWAYLITEKSLASNSCREELYYALDRALKTKDGMFPIIGLLHGVTIDQVPPALRTRLCISLADPTWVEQIKAGLLRKPTEASPTAPLSDYVFKTHPSIPDIPSIAAIEARPRFGEILHWRFAVPQSAKVKFWGTGAAGSPKSISGVSTGSIEGSMTINAETLKVRGTADRISAGVSAYVYFEGPIPPYFYFGVATGHGAFPTSWEKVSLK